MSDIDGLLNRLAGLDVELSVSDDGTRLCYDGPRAAVTDALLAELAEHRQALLDRLTRPPGPVVERAPASGRGAELPAPSAQSSDHGRRDPEHVTPAEIDRRVDWWASTLAGARLDLDLTPSRPVPARIGPSGTTLRRPVSDATMAGLGAAARRLDTTPAVLATAAMVVLLAAWSGRRDLVVLTSYADQARPDQESLVALTPHKVAVRVRLAGARTFADVVARTEQAARAAADHPVPFPRILTALRATGGPDGLAMPSVSFDVNSSVPRVAMSQLVVDGENCPSEVTRRELSFGLTPTGEQTWQAYAEVATDRYPAATIESLLDRYIALLAEVAADPDRGMGELLRVLAPVPALGPAVASGPLNVPQAGMFASLPRHPDPAVSNVVTRLRAHGELDVAALRGALGDLLARHESLRSRVLVTEDGEHLQEFCPAPPVELPVHDLRGLPVDQRLPRADEAVADLASTVFDLTRSTAPVWRLHRIDDRSWQLVLVLTHFVVDGWSLDLLLRELGQRYTARLGGHDPGPPPPVLGAGQYARRQLALLDEAELTARAARRAGELAGARFVDAAPPGRTRPEQPSGRGGTVRAVIPATTRQAVSRLARRLRSTEFAVCLSALGVLLAGRPSPGRSRDVVIGTPWSNRERLDEEGLVALVGLGAMVRIALDGASTFADVVPGTAAAARRAAADAVPAPRVLAALRASGDTDVPTASPVLYAFNADRILSLQWPGLTVQVADTPPPLARTDLAIGLSAGAGLDGWSAYCEYNADLWDEEAAQHLLDRYATLLAEAGADPDRPLEHFLVDPGRAS